MAKILGNSVGKFNKSCSAHHQESRDFTRINNLTILLKMYFCAGTPRTCQGFTNLTIFCTQTLRKISILTPRPSHCRVGLPTAIAGRPWPSSGAGPPRGSLRVEWRGRSARRRLQRGRAVAAGGGDLGELRLWPGRHNAEQLATAQDFMGSREELWVVGKYWVKMEGRVHRRPAMAGAVKQWEQRCWARGGNRRP
jgi:hypothetical protein